MSHPSEQEVRLQFLEETQEYIDTIEAFLLGLATAGIEAKAVDAALRAAHSIKGGAAMMGFEALSDLAHPLEDSFKVLKAQRQSITVDTALETLLLQALDGLRQVSQCFRRGEAIAPHWLTTQIMPTFEALRTRLGDPSPDDIASLLSEDAGQDMTVALFDSEVDGLLQRLEGVLANPQQPCLKEEVEIIALEMAGLGQMLQLDAFTSLCERVTHCLSNHSDDTDQIRAIAQTALQSWRKAYALVMVGQKNLISSEFILESSGSGDRTPATVIPEAETTTNVTAATLTPAIAPFTDHSTDLTATDLLADFEIPEDFLTSVMGELDSTVLFPDPAMSDSDFAAQQPISVGRSPLPTSPQTFPAPHPHPSVEPTPEAVAQENTVRVPLRLLEQINDLFGELIIERNALDLRLGRQSNLLQLLQQRMKNLEQANLQLRSFYDRISTEGIVPGANQNRTNQNNGNGLSPILPTTPRMDLKTLIAGTQTFDILEKDQYNDLHLVSQEQMETIVQIQEVTGDIEINLADTNQTANELNRTIKQLQQKVTLTRMRPLSDLVGRFPRAVRDMAVQYNKPTELKIYGGTTLIDRSVLEALSDPLLHLIRNAFDHGIEPPEIRQASGKPAQGRIELSAAHQGNQTIITIRDDGGGINLDKVRDRARTMGLEDEQLNAATEAELLDLIFEPGFSTADKVTALSGRGVGMDVVRTNLKQIRGEVTVQTKAGVGTTFTIAVPLTLSILRTLLVESRGLIMAIPTDAVEEMLALESTTLCTTAGQDLMNWDEMMVPLIRLEQWLSFNCPQPPVTVEDLPTINAPVVLMINQGNDWVGLQVERFWGEQEVAIRNVNGAIALPAGFGGCTILGDGRVVPVVNVPELLNWVMRGDGRRTTPSLLSDDYPSDPSATLPTTSTDSRNSHISDTVMVVDDSINVRRFLAMTLEKAGYQVLQAKDGQDAVEQLLGGVTVQAMVCDIEMPRLDGYGVLAQVKSEPHLKHIPITMLTSRSGDKHRQLAMQLGASAYFSKPYNERSLLQTLEELIHKQPSPVWA